MTMAKRITFRLPDDDAATLKSLADSLSMSTSALTRLLVMRGVRESQDNEVFEVRL